MSRRVALSVVVLVAVAIGATAMDWEEVDWGSEVVVDSSTGLPAVIFYATIEYSGSPRSYDFEGGWEAYEIVGGVHVPLDISPASAFLRGDTLRIYTATSPILVDTGKRYGATLTLEDTINNLSYQRTFTYSSGELLPYGISLRGWNGSQEDIDLKNLPDEELEELVRIYNLLTGYDPSPVEQTAKAFLRGDAAAKPDTAILRDGSVEEGQEIDRCTYSACGSGCCSTCIEHEESEEAQEAEATEETEEPAPDVRIECIMYEAAPFEKDGNEYVQLKNYGDLEQDLLGWTLAKRGDTKNIFTFEESFVLEPEMSIRVYTNADYAGEDGFSFGLEEDLWTNVVQYPVSLVLIPIPPSVSSAGPPVTVTVVLTLYTYTLASQDDINFVLGEIAQFDQDFDGRVYAGTGGSVLEGAKTVFVHDVAWKVLEAAAAEYRNR